mmetsp:Transcript_2467/g.4340  ORF Transcript_2467/g.4340 Transcript_2467/m.4340 type:complete len:221 (+) Transcript_2467:126-788(+)
MRRVAHRNQRIFSRYSFLCPFGTPHGHNKPNHCGNTNRTHRGLKEPDGHAVRPRLLVVIRILEGHKVRRAVHILLGHHGLVNGIRLAPVLPRDGSGEDPPGDLKPRREEEYPVQRLEGEISLVPRSRLQDLGPRRVRHGREVDIALQSYFFLRDLLPPRRKDALLESPLHDLSRRRFHVCLVQDNNNPTHRQPDHASRERDERRERQSRIVHEQRRARRP